MALPSHVRSTFNDVPGTIIREEYTVQEKNFVIRGVAHDTNVAKIAVRGVSDEPALPIKSSRLWLKPISMSI